MALRLVEVVIPRERASALGDLLRESETLGLWEEPLADDQVLLRVLIPAEHSESVLDAVEGRFAHVPGFRLLLFGVEATLPRPEPPAKEPAEGTSAAEATVAAQPAEGRPPPLRISREELYDDLAEGAALTRVFAITVVLSTVVAAIGLLRDDVAVIIGAMVIAPLLGPNIALALATTLGDGALARRSLVTNGVGLALALALSVVVGALVPAPPSAPEILSRAEVGLEHVALALASGAAGALAVTRGAATALVGVMVAVALLPPLVAAGLLLVAGQLSLAAGAFLLLATNVVCVNLAAVVTFLALGLRPRRWWEAKRAARATRLAVTSWVLLLAALVVFLLLSSTR